MKKEHQLTTVNLACSENNTQTISKSTKEVPKKPNMTFQGGRRSLRRNKNVESALDHNS